MLNKIFLMGRLTKDPELRRTQNGNAVTSFTVACDRDSKNEDGTRTADFIDVVCWKGTAEFVCSNFGKGRSILVCGRLQPRKWTDKDGNSRTAYEIQAETVYFCDSKKEEKTTGYTSPPPSDSLDDLAKRADSYFAAAPSGGFGFIPDDGELPF